MKVLKHYVIGLGLALAAALGSVAHAVERSIETVSIVNENTYGAAVAKFSVELAYQTDAQGDAVAAVNSDLVRDGHGYRQFSALALDLTSPELSV